VRTTLLFAEKALRQQARDVVGTLLTLLTTPLFTILYGLLAPEGAAAGPVRAFDVFVPGMLVFSVIMIVFSSSLGLAREIESGAMRRVRSWPVSAAAVLAGGGLVHLALAAIGAAVVLASARVLGFRSSVDLPAVLFLSIMGAVSSIGVGVVVAALTRTQGRAFLVGSVVMFHLLLFSGVVFPRPVVHLATVRGIALGPFDLLPTTHLHAAFSRLMAGGDLASVKLRVLAIALLSAAYFAAGVVVFRRRHGVGAGA
jgi:ABC-2 type transport system permease protein